MRCSRGARSLNVGDVCSSPQSRFGRRSSRTRIRSRRRRRSDGREGVRGRLTRRLSVTRLLKGGNTLASSHDPARLTTAFVGSPCVCRRGPVIARQGQGQGERQGEPQGGGEEGGAEVVRSFPPQVFAEAMKSPDEFFFLGDCSATSTLSKPPVSSSSVGRPP